MSRGRPSQGDEDNDIYNRNNPDTMILGKSVGTQYHKLTADEIPKHTHKTEEIYDNGSKGTGNHWTIEYPTNGNGGETHQFNVEAQTEGDGAHNNISPSFVLIYAIRILN